MTVEWDQEKETRLKELEKKLKSANLAWSEDQNQYLEEVCLTKALIDFTRDRNVANTQTATNSSSN